MDDLDILGADYIGGPAETAIAAGNRDENALTDLEFAARHPERKGARIQASETGLSKEWLSLRDSIVRPALDKAKLPTAPAEALAREAALSQAPAPQQASVSAPLVPVIRAASSHEAEIPAPYARPPAHAAPREARMTKNLAAATLIGSVVGAGAGAYLWKEHRVIGGILGYFVGSPAGAAAGLLLGLGE